MSEVVTFVFPNSDRTKTGSCPMPWVKDRTVQSYLHMHPLKGLGLIKAWLSSRTVNVKGVRVKLNYKPPAGDTIYIIPVPKVR